MKAPGSERNVFTFCHLSVTSLGTKSTKMSLTSPKEGRNAVLLLVRLRRANFFPSSSQQKKPNFTKLHLLTTELSCLFASKFRQTSIKLWKLLAVRTITSSGMSFQTIQAAFREFCEGKVDSLDPLSSA